MRETELRQTSRFGEAELTPTYQASNDRIEQAKSKDCHRHRENGEKGAQSLPERISYDEFKKRHMVREAGSERSSLLPAPISYYVS